MSFLEKLPFHSKPSHKISQNVVDKVPVDTNDNKDDLMALSDSDFKSETVTKPSEDAISRPCSGRGGFYDGEDPSAGPSEPASVKFQAADGDIVQQDVGQYGISGALLNSGLECSVIRPSTSLDAINSAKLFLRRQQPPRYATIGASEYDTPHYSGYSVVIV